MSGTGTIYGVGLGPGDPDLMSVKAHRLIGAARPRSHRARESGLHIEAFAGDLLQHLIPRGKHQLPLALAWRRLGPAPRQLVEEQVALLEDQTWEATAREDAEGIACLADGPCPRGEPGGLQQMTMTDAGRDALRASVETGVIGAWATRCEARSPGCAAAWNDTIGALLGFEARP